MKTLWLSPFLPYPDAPHAGARAIYQWLSRLGQKHEITFVCRAETRERANIDAIRPFCRAVHALEFDRPPPGPMAALKIAASYVRLGRLGGRLLRRERFDLLHVEYVETGLGVPRGVPVPHVLIAHDELTKPAWRRFEMATGVRARAATYAHWRAVRYLERHVCSKFDRILSASEFDRRVLLELDPELSVAVLPFPFGVDLARVRGPRDPDRLLFVGAMHRDVNVDAVQYFCREILPLIRRHVPDVRLAVVGNGPPPEIVRLAADPWIEVTGFVRALEPFYATAAVFVSPLRIGGGIIVKNLDAMATGCVLVTTTIGNEGIGATAGTHCLVADTPVEFAEAVVTLLRDEPLRERIAAAGQAFVRERFSLDASVGVLERVYRDLVPGGTR